MSLVGIAFTTRNSKKINTVCINTRWVLHWFHASLISHYWYRGKILITKSEYKIKQLKEFIKNKYKPNKTKENKQTNKQVHI
jgi:DNA modification methylase